MYVHAYRNGFGNVITSTSTEFSTYDFEFVLIKQKYLIWYDNWLAIETDKDEDDAYIRTFQRSFLPVKIKHIAKSKYISEEFATDLCEIQIFLLLYNRAQHVGFLFVAILLHHDRYGLLFEYLERKEILWKSKKWLK